MNATAELTEAQNNSAIARAKWEAAVAAGKRTAARHAALDLEFWSNKAAFLANVGGR
jgi:hypothetical protein